MRPLRNHRGRRCPMFIWCILSVVAASTASGIVRENSQDLLKRAAAHIDAKEYSEAISCFNEFLASDPNNARIWALQAAAHYLSGRPDVGLRCVDKALDIDPECVNAYKTKANILAGLNRLNEANHAQQNADTIVHRWQQIVGDLVQARKYQSAVTYCWKLVSNNVHVAWAWNEAGNCHYQMTQYSLALDCYERSLAQNDSDHIVLYNKGNCLLALERPQEAAECFEDALRLNSDAELVWRGRLRAMQALGNDVEAEAVLKKLQSFERRTRIKRFREKMPSYVGVCTVTGVLLSATLFFLYFQGKRRACLKTAGIAAALAACISAVVWLNLVWNWIPLLAFSVILVIVLAVWMCFGSRSPRDWALWLENRNARSALRWEHSTGPTKKDAALRLGGSTLRADLLALVAALRDAEVSSTASSVLRNIGPDPDVLRILKKALTREKNLLVRKTLSGIVEDYQRTLLHVEPSTGRKTLEPR